MRTQSAKAKGRKLQQWIAGQIRERFKLSERDVVSTSMGASGVDVKLSEKAFKAFPYAIECKARETFKTLYEYYEQQSGEPGEPLLVLKMNRKKPLIVVDAEHFMELARVRL